MHVGALMDVDWHLVQSRLAELGFNPGPIDGIKGPRTDAAIIAFKRSVGLRPRAYVGPITLAALRPAHNLDQDHLPWMVEALAIKGLHESRHVAQLRRWFDKSVSWIDPREVAWCGAFVATVYRKWKPGIDLPKNPLGARNWQHWGVECDPGLGACLVFWRGSRSGWKGHVGFYHGEDTTHYHVLGGNQRDSVTVSRIAKSRLLSARWPSGAPVQSKRILVTPGGVLTTTNEA